MRRSVVFLLIVIACLLSACSSLGADVLLAERAEVCEHISPQSADWLGYRIELLALSTQAHLAPVDLIGQPVLLELLLLPLNPPPVLVDAVVVVVPVLLPPLLAAPLGVLAAMAARSVTASLAASAFFRYTT